MNVPPDPKRENPEELAFDGVSEGIEALPGRLDRYGKAKKSAIDVAQYMALEPDYQKQARRLLSCGDYLVFKHYYTVDQVRLAGASLCGMSLLCPLCAIRRGAKALKAYLDRFDAITALNPRLKPFLVTLTVKDGHDLKERFNHLHKSQAELWKRKQRGRGSVLDGVAGAVWSYEVKKGKNSRLWHPHLHMIVLSENIPDQAALSAEWHNITGDSFVVDVRPINQDDLAAGFMEVFKYAVKFSDQPVQDTVHAWETLFGKRLIDSSGCFRGVAVPATLLDDSEGLNDLPFVKLFYRYLHGAGYSLRDRAVAMADPPRKANRVPGAFEVYRGPPSYSAGDFQVAYENRVRDAALKVHKPLDRKGLR